MKNGFKVKWVLASFVMLSAVGCSTLSDTHGYIPTDLELADVIVGRDTKDTVTRIVGRPGARGVIGDSSWYYIESDYERFLWRAPVEVDREVVAISFTENEVVENVERFGLEDGRVIVLNRRVTDSNVKGIGFLRQLFSNIGNLDGGQFIEE